MSQNNNGGFFKFDKYKTSLKNQYQNIVQKDIKAVRLSVRILSDTITNNKFLFYPNQQSGNRIGLFDLIIWAINNNNLKIYTPKVPNFEKQISIDSVYEVVRRSNRYETYYYEQQSFDSIKTFTLNSSSIKKFYLLESTIIGNDDSIITTRPLGLCPIFNDTLSIFESEKIEYSIWERALFWVYFPDIMPVLANHFPETEINGINNTLDFFLKSYYQGELDKYQHFDYSKMDIDVSLEAKGVNKDGYNIDWIYNSTNDGMYVNPYDKKFQGNPEIKSTMPIFDNKDQPLTISEIHSAKYVYKTVDLRNIENYPLHFPYESNFGQSSLIDILLNGVQNKTINAYKNSDSYQPIQLSELDEVMKNSLLVPIIDYDGNMFYDSVIIEKIPNYDVCKYLLKEVEFYDIAGKLIGSKIIGISPIVKHVSTQKAYYNYAEPAYQPVFFVSFADSAVRNLLNQNFTYRFSKNDNSTFYSFFKDNKYKTDTTNWTVDASIYTALWELKLSPVNFLFPFKSKKNQIFENISEKKTIDSTFMFSEIACAKYKTISIHIDDPNNASLKQSMTSNINPNCFIELIMDAINKGEITAYSNNKAISYSKAVELISFYTEHFFYDDSDIPKADTVLIYNPKSTVTMYDIKLAVFYNSQGKEIGSKVLGFYPINQYNRSEISGCGMIFQEDINEPAFYIPFDTSTEKFLSKHYAYEFKNGIKISYLSYFKQKLYTVKSDSFQAVGIEHSLKECGVNKPFIIKSSNNVQNSSYDRLIPIATNVTPKLIFRELLNDTLNYKYFYSFSELNGLQNFSDFLFSCIETEKVISYEYNEEGDFVSNISKSDIKEKILNQRKQILFIQNTYDSLTYPDSVLYNLNLVVKYILKELQIGDTSIVLGICPVMEYEAEPGYFVQSELFWASFNKDFRTLMGNTEVVRLHCEPLKTFWDCFQNHSYHGNIISEKTISVQDAEKLINDLK